MQLYIIVHTVYNLYGVWGLVTGTALCSTLPQPSRVVADVLDQVSSPFREIQVTESNSSLQIPCGGDNAAVCTYSVVFSGYDV
jgi:hypothetical protein